MILLSRTPFRISFLGGGTDFPFFFEKSGGFCLATTIDKYSYIYLRRLDGKFGFQNEFIYSKFERTSNNLNEIKHPIIREALRLEGIEGIRLDYDADIPARTGLATSSSFAVGLVNTLGAFKGETRTKRELADKAIHIERVMCNEVGGIQDQISSAFGGLNLIEFSKNGYDVHSVQLSKRRKLDFQTNLMLFYTKIQRTSSEIQKKIKTPGEINKNLLTLKHLAIEGYECLTNEKQNLDDFGQILNQAWKSKKGLSDAVTTSFIDECYVKGLEAGALGGKVLGAGGGGFLLFYVPYSRQEAVRNALSDLIEIKFCFEEQGSQILLNFKDDL